METVLITGANRGIGLELVKQFLNEKKYKIYACCRNTEKAKELAELSLQYPDNLDVLPLDVTNADSISAVSSQLEGQAIDILINNAGVYLDKGRGLLDANFEDWLQTFNINSVAPFRIIKALYPNLDRSESAKILTISSQMGAMSRPSGGSYAYCASKAAVNKAMIGLALDLKSHNIAIAVAHPGWVQTDMGGAAAEITPLQSAEGLFSVATNLSMEDTGAFFKWNGERHDW